MKLQLPHTVRLVGGLLAGALVVTASPLVGLPAAQAAEALPPAANPIGADAFCDGAPADNPFTDIGTETAATRATILCLVATEVTTGVTATKYLPSGSVSRRQMALFIKRLADLANELETTGLTGLPVYDGTEDYSDIGAESSEVKEAIGQLSQAKIVSGTSATFYKPSALVTRRQMAAFVNRLQEFLTGTPFTSTGNYFDDDDGDPGEADLNALAGAGIFQGDGQGSVFPGASLTRRQMANILMRDAQVMLAAGDIRRPFSSLSLDVKPTSTSTLTWVDNPETPSNTADDRVYTASNLEAGATYKVALFPSGNVRLETNGLTFADANADNQADGAGSAAADILTVNGQSNELPVASAQPVNGSITFTVDGDNADETIVPVVWLDRGPHANQLDLVVPTTANSDPKPPSEAVGAGGAISYVPVQAAFGAHTSSDVTSVNISNNFFVAQTDVEHPALSETFYYDSNDVFQHIGTGITLAQFESMISPRDTLTIHYEQNAPGVSTFNITADAAPVAPNIKSIAVKNADGGASANDVQVTITPPPDNASGVTYALEQRSDTQGETDTQAPPPYPNAPPTCSNGVTSWTAWAPTSTTSTANANGTLTLNRPNAANGCHDYRIVAKNPVSGTTATGSAWSATSGSVGVQVPANLVAPISTSLTQTNGGSGTGAVAGSLDRSDTITIVFNRAMNPGGRIRFRDGDGTVVDVTCGAAAPYAACSVNTDPVFAGGSIQQARRVLTVKLLADPTPVTPGTSPDLAIATGVAIEHSGVTDQSGTGWNIAGSSDTALA